MTEEGWTLDVDSEATYLVPWLNDEVDEAVREQVVRWIADLVVDPVGRGHEDVPGVYSAVVPRTAVNVVWLLDVEERSVVLVLMGSV